MLSKAKTLESYKLLSREGEIGKVKEFYFDDNHWTVRYLVADTGNWLTGRQVLISPYALTAVNKDHRTIVVDLTRKQIEDSPALDSDKPVSLQYEKRYYGFYGWPMYWGGPLMWGSYPTLYHDPEKMRGPAPHEKAWDPHLRSTKHVNGHLLQAIDGEIGHVEDFIIDDETWAIRYLIVDTQNWWPGQRVLVSPRWIQSVSWGQSKVFVDLSREEIKRSPAYINEGQFTRDYEEDLHKHYNRKGYWVEDLAGQQHFY